LGFGRTLADVIAVFELSEIRARMIAAVHVREDA